MIRGLRMHMGLERGVCVCMSVCLCVCVSVFMCKCLYVHVFLCVYMCACVCMCMHVCGRVEQQEGVSRRYRESCTSLLTTQITAESIPPTVQHRSWLSLTGALRHLTSRSQVSKSKLIHHREMLVLPSMRCPEIGSHSLVNTAM